jgi:two-component system, NtrC family, response regulator
MSIRPRVLVVEDDDSLRQVMQAQLAKEGYEALTAPDVPTALITLEKSLPQLVITDLNLPGLSGIDLLKRVRTDYPGLALIVMTAFGTVQSAVEAMKSGAYDYIVKPIHPYELKALVGRALDHHRLIEEVQVLRSSLEEKYGFEQIIGSSRTLLAALDIARRVASTDATILIHGETGTGKELIAKAIHLRSSRRNRPFATINCAAIPRELLESELFGYLKGSFTGALGHKKGKVEMVDGGTLLLDEIGEMPLELQVRILRLIQEKEIEKVGATSPTKVDVRIMAATHRDLAAMVHDGSFREDLYYRLLVVPIEVPPLRERLEDIPELIQHFFVSCKAKHGRPDLTMASTLVPYFSNYSWPGNVRQLQHVIERLVLLARGSEITPEDLPEFLWFQNPYETTVTRDLPDDGVSLTNLEKNLILQVLAKFSGNQTSAARYLGVSRRTLAYRMKKYRIPPEHVKEAHQAAR